MPIASTPSRRRLYAASLGAILAICVGAFILHQTLSGTSGGGELFLWSIALAATWFSGAALLVLLVPPARFDSRLGGRLRIHAHPMLYALVIGILFAIVSLVGALVIRVIPAFAGDVTGATARVSDSPVLVFVVALITGGAEELFFRVGLSRLIPGRWAVPVSTVLYGVVTLSSNNLPLALAAVLLGFVSAVTLAATGKWYTPLIVHGLWTVALIGVLPRL